MSDLLSEFLATGTIRRKTISLYADQAAYDELAAIRAEIDATRDGDLTDDVRQRWDAAKARLVASRADITVARLTEPIRVQIDAQLPIPDPPRPVGRGATKERTERFEAERDEWTQKLLENTTERESLALSFAVERFAFAGSERSRVLGTDGGVAEPALSVDELTQLFEANDAWRRILVEALNEVSTLGAEPDAPFLDANSGLGPA